MSAVPDGLLIAKLTAAIGRVDAGSVGGYEFRRHVAKTDLLPLVKALLKEHACSCPIISDVDDHCPQHGRDT